MYFQTLLTKIKKTSADNICIRYALSVLALQNYILVKLGVLTPLPEISLSGVKNKEVVE